MHTSNEMYQKLKNTKKKSGDVLGHKGSITSAFMSDISNAFVPKAHLDPST